MASPPPASPQTRLNAFAGAVGAWEWDAASDRLYGDARFAELYKLPPEDLKAGVPTAAFFSAVHPDDQMRVRIAVAGVLHGADLFSKDFRLIAEGAVRWVSARGRAEHSEAGALVSFTGVLTDITEQKRIEEQLRVAQSAGGVGTFEYVDGFGTVSVSAQFCHVLGLHVADTLPVRTINAVMAPGQPPLIGGAISPEFASVYAELEIRRADTGETSWIACRGEHQREAGGVGLRFIGVIYDVTQNKRVEAQLRELAATLEERVEERTQERDRVWTLSRDLIAISDAQGRFRAVNPAWKALLGYSSDELVGSRFDTLVLPDDRPLSEMTFRSVLRAMPVHDLDVRIRTKEGGYRWINWDVMRVGETFYGIGRDVTERKLLEEQLRQSQKMEAVGQLTGGLAHDLNNMLTGIIGGMDMARRRITEGRVDDSARFMETAVTSAERAAALTHRLLAFSRQQSLDTRPVDVNRLIASMEDMLRRTLGEQIRLEVMLAADAWSALSDQNQLESAILNLAINARDAMPTGGRLVIGSRNVSLDAAAARATTGVAPGDYVAVCVGDTGSGMSQSTIDKAFEPFFTTKPIGQGTGLGLSMVYGFVRQSGGHVQIESAPGKGTTINLYLPRSVAEQAQPSPAPSEAPQGAGERVLVVEDDPSVRMLVLEVLRDLRYEAIAAGNADEALLELNSPRAIDLMVSDVGLPGLNGRQLAEIARAGRPDLPILFITGYAPDASVRASFLAPGMDMITKPFVIDSLGSKIREMIGARER